MSTESKSTGTTTSPVASRHYTPADGPAEGGAASSCAPGERHSRPGGGGACGRGCGPSSIPAPDSQALVAAAPPVPVREIFRRFWPYARPYRRWIAVGLVLIAVVPAIDTAMIWMFKLVVDDVLVPQSFGPLPVDRSRLPRPDAPGRDLLLPRRLRVDLGRRALPALDCAPTSSATSKACRSGSSSAAGSATCCRG